MYFKGFSMPCPPHVACYIPARPLQFLFNQFRVPLGLWLYVFWPSWVVDALHMTAHECAAHSISPHVVWGRGAPRLLVKRYFGMLACRRSEKRTINTFPDTAIPLKRQLCGCW